MAINPSSRLANEVSPQKPGAATSAPRRTFVTDSFAFKNRGLIGVIFLAPAVLAAIFGTPFFADGGVFAQASALIGWMFFLAYLAIRIWATLYIGGSKDFRLQTVGPYSITRNPLYLGSLCFAFSVAFFLKNLSVVGLTVMVAAIYVRGVIPAEEESLESIFGQEFLDYKTRTSRLFPRFSTYQAGPTVEVNLRALRTEAKRLALASLMPFLALRVLPVHHLAWWPSWFRLP